MNLSKSILLFGVFVGLAPGIKAADGLTADQGECLAQADKDLGGSINYLAIDSLTGATTDIRQTFNITETTTEKGGGFGAIAALRILPFSVSYTDYSVTKVTQGVANCVNPKHAIQEAKKPNVSAKALFQHTVVGGAHNR